MREKMNSLLFYVLFKNLSYMESLFFGGNLFKDMHVSHLFWNGTTVWFLQSHPMDHPMQSPLLLIDWLILQCLTPYRQYFGYITAAFIVARDSNAWIINMCKGERHLTQMFNYFLNNVLCKLCLKLKSFLAGLC